MLVEEAVTALVSHPHRTSRASQCRFLGDGRMQAVLVVVNLSERGRMHLWV